MAEKLEVIITATDKASGVLSSIGKLGGGILKAGLLGAGAAVAGLAAGLGYAVNEAMEAQEVVSQLDAVLKSTGGAAGVTRDMATGLADSLGKVTRFSDEAVLSGENMLLTFTNIGKDVFPDATTAMLDMSQALGQDIKSSAIQLGKALNDPVQGITALQRVGVSFTDEQKKMVEGMVAAGDVMGAQKFILAELQKEFGGSAEAAGQTFAGQLDILKNSLENVAEGVGTAVLPILQSLMDTVIIPIIPYIQAFAEGVKILFDEFSRGAEQGGLLGGVMEVLDNFLSEEMIATIWNTIDAVKAWIDEGLAVLIPWLQDAIPAALAFLADVWQTVLLPALQFVWNFISTVLVPIFMDVVVPILQVVVPAALQILASFWTDVLKPAISAVFDWLNGTLMPFLQGTVVPWLKEHIPQAIQVLSDFWTNTLQPAMEDVWSWISGTLIPFLQDTVVPFLQDTFTAAIQTLSDYWTNTLKPALDEVWSFINTYVKPIFDDLVELFNITLKLAVETISEVWSGTLKPALEGVWSFISTYLLPIFNDVKDWFENKIGPVINTLVSGALAALKSTLSGIHDLLSWIIDKLSKLNGTKVENPVGGGVKLEASGGPVASGQTYLVGEEGPELFVPRISGSIIPAGLTAAMRSPLGLGAAQSTRAGSGASISIYGGLHITGVQRPDDLLSALSEYMV